ncbi:winged helix-turn-helix domain-containing protein [Bacillus pacificus]
MNLTRRMQLLLFLAKAPDKVFDREQLLKESDGNMNSSEDLRTVDTHVKRLREKLSKKSPDAAKMIVTVWE